MLTIFEPKKVEYKKETFEKISSNLLFKYPLTTSEIRSSLITKDLTHITMKQSDNLDWFDNEEFKDLKNYTQIENSYSEELFTNGQAYEHLLFTDCKDHYFFTINLDNYSWHLYPLFISCKGTTTDYEVYPNFNNFNDYFDFYKDYLVSCKILESIQLNHTRTVYL